jgi:hypothetical protein
MANLQQQQEELWLVQTPPRVEGLQSPPYVVVKSEDPDLEVDSALQ